MDGLVWILKIHLLYSYVYECTACGLGPADTQKRASSRTGVTDAYEPNPSPLQGNKFS